MKTLTMYCNKCGSKMIDTAMHPGKQEWFCDDCGKQDEVDVSIFIEETKPSTDWRKHKCGKCGYWCKENTHIVNPGFEGSTTRKGPEIQVYSGCKNGDRPKGHAACPDFVPREVSDGND